MDKVHKPSNSDMLSSFQSLPNHITSLKPMHVLMSRLVGRAIGYGLDDRAFGVRVSVALRIFSSQSRPNPFWGSPSLLSHGCRGSFPGVKLTIHLQLVTRSRKQKGFLHRIRIQNDSNTTCPYGSTFPYRM
jgi:hypothetical protein